MEKQFDIIDTASAAGNFSTLAAALGAAGLIETSKGRAVLSLSSLRLTMRFRKFRPKL